MDVLCCPSCGSRFFKTLELRFELLLEKVRALLYKKRCKRCKQKYLIELTANAGKAVFNFASPLQWHQAQRVQGSPFESMNRMKAPLVGDYTFLISSDTASIFNLLLQRGF